MERRQRFLLTGIESDAEGTRPYPIRMICAIEGGHQLVVWGHPQEEHNVEVLREATFPCTILCVATTPPQLPHVPEAVAWVHPNHVLKIL